MSKKAIVLIVIISFLVILFIGYKNYNRSKNEMNNTTTIDNIEIEDIEEEKLNENKNENIIDENKSEINNVVEDNNTESNIKTKTEEKKVEKEISPSGFMGSSSYKVILYTNGEVYVQTFDGNGYEKENIVSDEIIARKCKYIKKSEDDETYGMIIVKAEEIINERIGWIAFE